jgi:hypothetical protein
MRIYTPFMSCLYDLLTYLNFGGMPLKGTTVMVKCIDGCTRAAVTRRRGRRHEAAIVLWRPKLAERVWHKGCTGAQA